VKFYAALLSFVSSTQRKLIKKEFDGSAIELAERLLMENCKYVSENENEPLLYFGNFILGSKNELLAGDIGRLSTVKLPDYQDGKFLDEEHKAYPYVHFLWDRSHQLILLEVNTSVFRNYESLIRLIEIHLNKLLDDYEYTVYIEPLTEKANFWNMVSSFERLYDVTFEMHMPNFLGRTQEDMKEMLNHYRPYNVTTLTNKLSNNLGKLKISPNDESLNLILEWITKGAGIWKLRGIKWGKNKKITISSKKDEYMKSLETSIVLENFAPEEVKRIITDLNLDSLLVDPTNENPKK
jgi:hypothetical protein